MNRRVAFHQAFDFHNAILMPVCRNLERDFDCLYSREVKDIIAFKPDILVISDLHTHLFRTSLPQSIIIGTRHGIISKNCMPRLAHRLDFVCVTGPWVTEDFRMRKSLPRFGFWTTGFIPSDVIFNEPPLKHTPAWPSHFSSEGPTLLYAPTHTPSLTSVEILGHRWVELLKNTFPAINILIKPHPHFIDQRSPWLEEMRAIAASLPGVHLVDDSGANIYQLFSSADILLSDISSVVYLFLLCNRPIILVNNPKSLSDRDYFDPRGIEWQWRDCLESINDPAELPEAIRRCQQEPDPMEEKRLHYRDLLFDPSTFGKAASLLSEKIRFLLSPPHEHRETIEAFWSCAGRLNTFEFAPSVKALLCNLGRNSKDFAKIRLEHHPGIKNYIKKLWRLVDRNEQKHR
jgi:hypothetical protein